MQQVRFGIVGVGNMGSAHLSHILRGNVPELTVHAWTRQKERRDRTS